MSENPNCDGSGPHTRRSHEVRLLPLGGGANLILCRACWLRETEWRKQRNRHLSRDCQFKLPIWEELEIYPTEDVIDVV